MNGRKSSEGLSLPGQKDRPEAIRFPAREKKKEEKL